MNATFNNLRPINMPAEITSDLHLKKIPMGIFTTSKADEDIAHAYGSHANRFITKLVGFANVDEVLRAIPL